jgi:hypothetical protein
VPFLMPPLHLYINITARPPSRRPATLERATLEDVGE